MLSMRSKTKARTAPERSEGQHELESNHYLRLTHITAEPMKPMIANGMSIKSPRSIKSASDMKANIRLLTAAQMAVIVANFFICVIN